MMVREVNTAAILIEMAFIDNVDDAKLLKDKHEEFAISIAKGILKYFNIAWKEEQAQPSTSSLYRVCVGAFSVKSNAENKVKELKAKGIDCYIHSC